METTKPGSGPGQGTSTAGRIDPDIARFAARVTADYEKYTGGKEVSPQEMRKVAEKVREPWRKGGPTMQQTTEYTATTKAGDVRLRVYDPGVKRPSPALVYMHGGGWVLFSLDSHDRVMREYATRSGMIVVGVDYSLAPEARFPVALEQVVGVVHWLREHGASLGIDTSRIALGGDSAGGNLSITAALALRDAGHADAVHGLLLIYPALDDGASPEALRQFGGPGNVLTGDEIKWFWNHYTGGVNLHDNPLACPARAKLEGLPPVCLTIPECDVLTEQGLQMADRLKAAGVDTSLTVYPGATHSFIEAMSIAPVADRAISDGARWLREKLGSSARKD